MFLFLAQVTTPEVTIPSFTLPSIVVTIIVAALCGALAQLIVGFTRGGLLAAFVVGIVGALIGQWLASALRLPNLIVIAGVDIVWTVIGSAILAALLVLAIGGRRFRRRRSYRSY